MIPKLRARNRTSLALTLALLGYGTTSPAPAAPPEEGKATAKAPDYPNTPEGAFKTFLMAMGTGDEAKLREVTLPNEGFEWLLKGHHVPPQKLESYRKGFVEGTPILRLKPGDETNLPGGRKAKVGPEEVADDRAVLYQKGAPLLTRCRKVEGRWRIDAGPMIAGRQAAEAARLRALERAKGVGGGAAPAQP